LYHRLCHGVFVAIPDEDGSLALASSRLSDAVAALAEPLWEHTRQVPPLYDRVRSTLAGGRTGAQGRRVATSRAPLRADILNWLVEVDGSVRLWASEFSEFCHFGNFPSFKGGTVDRLRALRDLPWRPQDCGLMSRRSRVIERWAVAAAGLVEHTPVVALEHPCPRCEKRWFYRRDSGGDRVRARALSVSEHGARCGACGAVWPPAEFGWLAQLLGCTPAV